jgi:hypothetical protein
MVKTQIFSTNSKSMQLGGKIKATTAACKIDL